MSEYDILTKYIELFDLDDIGKWFFDEENDGTMEHPIKMPYVDYSRIVGNFIRDVHLCAEQMGINNYVEILNKYGIEWEKSSMKNADINSLPSEVVLALLLGAVRAERFCDGALLSFFQNGCIQKWLSKLREV